MLIQSYLIDPFEKTIQAVPLKHEPERYELLNEEIHKHIHACIFVQVRINRERDCIYVDDRGLHNTPLNQKTQRYFKIASYGAQLAGYGLVLGLTYSGDSCPPRETLKHLSPRITWQKF